MHIFSAGARRTACGGLMFVRYHRRLGGVSRLLKFWMALAIAIILTLSESLPAMHFGIHFCLSVCLSKFILISPSQSYYGSVKHNNNPASIINAVKRYTLLFRA